VLSAIDLHDDTAFQAQEIDDISTDRALTSELVAAESTCTQMPPKQALCIRLIMAKLPRPVAAPHPNPLPVHGERESGPGQLATTSVVRITEATGDTF